MFIRGVAGIAVVLITIALVVTGGAISYLGLMPGSAASTTSTSTRTGVPSTSSTSTWKSVTSSTPSASSTTSFMTTTTSQASTSSSASASSTQNSITVTSHDLHNGNTLVGFFVDLRLNSNHIQSGSTPVTFSGLQSGVQYLVVVYWYGNYYFRHFSDGNLNRYALITFNKISGQTSYALDALYESVPSSQAASLNIIAQFPNGTQIGTAFDNNGYPQHTPGMWLTVTPPGSTIPFTATFTGGSILPFTFFNGQTYTVEMSTGYNNVKFSHWKDTGSTNPDRSISLNGSQSYIAVYVVVP
jgi:hypothetical protein